MVVAIDRIENIDTRSAMLDMQDRLMVAEKALEHAKTLFKSVAPRQWPRASGYGAPAVSAEQVVALRQLVAILTDDEKLSTVGLSFDGRRVRRKTGTRDELLAPGVLTGVHALLQALS